MSNTLTTRLAKLNDNQKKAVDTIEGPVMVIAGPGTGKTETLGARIANILETQTDIHAGNILCLTYTTAGVVAMRKRLQEFIGSSAYKVQIHTFHSFCNMIIQDNADYFGIKSAENISELEQYECVEKIIDELPVDHPLFHKNSYHDARNLLGLFSTMKAETWTVEVIETAVEKFLQDLPNDPKMQYKKKYTDRKTGHVYQAGDAKPKAIADETAKKKKFLAAAQLFPEYQEYLQTKGLYDFNDMIVWILEAFKKDENFLAQYQEQFQYILVDEFQDTNGSQKKLIDHLCNYWDEPNIFVVGDDDQSIYRFQGANMRNIMEFYAQHKEKISIITLDKNYRSSQNILDIAEHIIEKNTERLVSEIPDATKTLTAENPNFADIPTKPSLREYYNSLHEELGIIKRLKALQKKGEDLSKVAVIYQNHAQVENILKICEQEKIPVRIKESQNVLEIPLIMQVITLLEYFSEEQEKPFSAEEKIFRAMFFPFFGIEKSDITMLALKRRKAETDEDEFFRSLIGAYSLDLSPPDKGDLGGFKKTNDLQFIPYDRELTQKAQELRKNMPPAEKKMWFDILHTPVFQKYKFLRQKPLSHYIVDFYCAELQVVIEIDGDSHYEKGEDQKDEERTKKLEQYGLQVLRYTNQEIHSNLEGVYDDVVQKLCLSEPNPLSPPCQGEAQTPSETGVIPPSVRWARGELAPAYPQNSPLQNFAQTFDQLQEDYISLPLVPFVEKIFTRCGIIDWVMQQDEKAFLLRSLSTFFQFIKDEAAQNPDFCIADMQEKLKRMKTHGLTLPIQKILYEKEGVNFITAHSSKGLEFDYVFLIGVNKRIWDRERPASFSFPDTLTFSNSGDFLEEKRRLFFVAITRAKKFIEVSYAKNNLHGKEEDPSIFIAEYSEKISPETIEYPEEEILSLQGNLFKNEENKEIDFLQAEFLRPLLENYTMSPTHLNKYLKCPLSFYFENLLRIPSAMPPAAGFGTAIHSALEKLFIEAQQEKKFSETHLIQNFTTEMQKQRFLCTDAEYTKLLQYGKKILPQYFENYLGEKSDTEPSRSVNIGKYKVEKSIRTNIGEVPVSGKMDRVDIIESGAIPQVNITDYKTGNASSSFTKEKCLAPCDKNEMQGGDYWRQIVFYALLAENNPTAQWEMKQGIIDFVEPDKTGDFTQKKFSISPEDKKLVQEQIETSYKKIMNMEFYGCGEEDCGWCGG